MNGEPGRVSGHRIGTSEQEVWQRARMKHIQSITRVPKNAQVDLIEILVSEIRTFLIALVLGLELYKNRKASPVP